MTPPNLGFRLFALLLALSGTGGASLSVENGALQTAQRIITRRFALSSIVLPTAAVTVAAAATTIFPAHVAAANDDSLTVASASSAPQKAQFRRYPQIRFIAALGDPISSSGTGADGWGLWRDDPGPRGVYLRDYDSRIASRGGVAPAGWTFRGDDWWLEEHGLIMSNPEELPRKRYDRERGEVVPYKRYVVTGDREVTTVLTVREDGRWELAKGTLYDVTHLPCRSARYTQPKGMDVNVAEVGATGTTTTTTTASLCVPPNADRKAFPVKPGAEMPQVAGCAKQDYAVLFVLGEET